MSSRILVTGGDGRFAKILKEKNKKLDLIFLSKNQLDILDSNSIVKAIRKFFLLIILKSNSVSI